MVSIWFLILCEITVIGATLVSGLFLTFSSFLMRALTSGGAAVCFLIASTLLAQGM